MGEHSTPHSKAFAHFGLGYAEDVSAEMEDNFSGDLSLAHQMNSPERRKQAPLKPMRNETRGIAHRTLNVLDFVMHGSADASKLRKAGKDGGGPNVQTYAEDTAEELQKKRKREQEETDPNAVFQGAVKEVMKRNGW